MGCDNSRGNCAPGTGSESLAANGGGDRQIAVGHRERQRRGACGLFRSERELSLRR